MRLLFLILNRFNSWVGLIFNSSAQAVRGILLPLGVIFQLRQNSEEARRDQLWRALLAFLMPSFDPLLQHEQSPRTGFLLLLHLLLQYFAEIKTLKIRLSLWNNKSGLLWALKFTLRQVYCFSWSENDDNWPVKDFISSKYQTLFPTRVAQLDWNPIWNLVQLELDWKLVGQGHEISGLSNWKIRSNWKIGIHLDDWIFTLSGPKKVPKTGYFGRKKYF